MDLFDFENYKNEKGQHTVFYEQQLEYDLIKSIPTQIEKFFEMQKYETESDLFTEEKLSEALKKSIIEKINDVKNFQRRPSALLQNMQEIKDKQQKEQ